MFIPLRFAGALLVVVSYLAASSVDAPSASAAEQYRFTYRGLQVGDEAVQQADFDLEVNVKMEQSGQVIDSSDQRVSRSQQCRITVLKTGVVDGLPVKTKVKLAFDSARQQAEIDGETKGPSTLPVEGNTYHAELVQGKLVITDTQGNVPSEREQQIVAATTQTLGKPNPLAKFFHGRSIAVGETVKMPPQLAKDLLGFTGRLDATSRFEITLTGIQNYDGVPCALFETQLGSQGPAGDRFNVQMSGRLLLQVGTCRTVWIELVGPVDVSEARGPEGGRFTVTTKGNVKMALQAKYSQPRF